MSRKNNTARRVLGLAALSGIGLAAAPAAHAATQAPDTADGPMPTTYSAPPQFTTDSMTDGLKSMPLYPLGGTTFDPLSNSLTLPMGDGALSTAPLTEPFEHKLPLRDVPVLGDLVPDHWPGT